ncbi:MAG: SCO family protein [Desulforhopalus sp.]|nr:SCO family protein [Desulforhopalus sp.]
MKVSFRALVIISLLVVALGAAHPDALLWAHGGEEHGADAAEILSGEGSLDPSEWVAEKAGQYLPLDLQFTDESGLPIRLDAIIDRPTIILPTYYFCPNGCSLNLANLAGAVGGMTARSGKDYRVIALSFNDVEGPKDAVRAKNNYLKLLPENFPASEWRFLTGSSEAIKAATDALGFRFQRLNDQTFIHPAALMIVAADGKIIRYVYGSFVAGDIDLAVSAAASGTPIMSVRRLLGFCFNYDPHGKSGLITTVKIIVLMVFAGIVIGVFLFYRRRGRGVATADKAHRGP